MEWSIANESAFRPFALDRGLRQKGHRMGNNRQVDRKSAVEAARGPLSESGDPVVRPAPHLHSVEVDVPTPRANDAVPMRGANDAGVVRVIGYASCVHTGPTAALELKEQARVITGECKCRGFELIELVGERNPATGKGLSRPGLSYALDRIKAGEATGLLVVELSQITQSVGELGTIMEWLRRLEVRLIASADAFDSESEEGHLAAELLIEVSKWERNRISERTRNGLQAARMSGRAAGRPAVADDPDLSRRIAHMRAQGMTLQAIADRLNEEGVPTVRGGTKWRHSSVQAAAGYRRDTRRPAGALQIAPAPGGEQGVG
jgi:DNA invertase Pin-like site-specific DNA recombinase